MKRRKLLSVFFLIFSSTSSEWRSPSNHGKSYIGTLNDEGISINSNKVRSWRFQSVIYLNFVESVLIRNLAWVVIELIGETRERDVEPNLSGGARLEKLECGESWSCVICVVRPPIESRVCDHNSPCCEYLHLYIAGVSSPTRVTVTNSILTSSVSRASGRTSVRLLNPESVITVPKGVNTNVPCSIKRILYYYLGESLSSSVLVVKGSSIGPCSSENVEIAISYSLSLVQTDDEIGCRETVDVVVVPSVWSEWSSNVPSDGKGSGHLFTIVSTVFWKAIALSRKADSVAAPRATWSTSTDLSDRNNVRGSVRSENSNVPSSHSCVGNYEVEHLIIGPVSVVPKVWGGKLSELDVKIDISCTRLLDMNSEGSLGNNIEGIIVELILLYWSAHIHIQGDVWIRFFLSMKKLRTKNKR